MQIVVYSQYYRCRTPERQLEIDECLRRNLNHPAISRVVLFKETDAPALPEGTVPVEVVESDQRLTYAEWLRWIKRQASGIGLLLNADIYLDQGLEHLEACLNCPEVFLALTRYNPGHVGLHLNDFPHWTQDVWGVRADAELPESLLYASSFPLGFPGCDNRIAYVMWSHGFRVRNPCYHVRSVHLQSGTARSYHKTGDRLYGGVSYVHPSLAPDEDGELEFTLWTRSQQRPAGVLINQQAIEQGLHQLCDGELDLAQPFLDQQLFTRLSWVHEAVGSAHLEGNVHSVASEDTVFLPLPALLGEGVSLQLRSPTRLEGLTLRLPRRAQLGYQLELQAEGGGKAQLVIKGESAVVLKPGGARLFLQPAELKAHLWTRLWLKLLGPVAEPSWRAEEGAELVLFGENGSIALAKSLNVIAEPSAAGGAQPSHLESQPVTIAEQAQPMPASYSWRRRSDCAAPLEQGEELQRYGSRFRVLRFEGKLVFDDRFWPSVGLSAVADLPCELSDRRGLFLWGFGQPMLELRPGFIANTKRFAEDVNFWQYPCRTEGDAFAVHQTLVGPQITDRVLQLYLGLPWATWIDLSSWPTSTLKVTADRLRALRQELYHLGLGLKVHSVCQHILWRENIHLIKAAGVHCLWLSHKPQEEFEEAGVELRPWHLYPVRAREDVYCATLVIKPMAQRTWLASFIGSYMNHYISEVRLHLQDFKDLHRFYIQLQDERCFYPNMHFQQVGNSGLISLKNTQDVHLDDLRYNKVLSDSQFSLCPAGAGPNSSRLWESLTIGSIPVILSDQLVLPDLAELSGGRFSCWDEIVLFHPESDLSSLPDRLEAIHLDELRHRSERAIELMQLVNNHSCMGQPAQRTLQALPYQAEPDSSKPTIVVPVYGPTDRWYWRLKKHGFYNVVLEWYLRDYVEIKLGGKGFFWWGSQGEILLMERDNILDLEDKNRGRPRWKAYPDYKYAFFFNQYFLENDRNFKATFFAYDQPTLEILRNSIGRLSYDERSIDSFFAGSVENEVQEYFREKFKSWEDCLDKFLIADKFNNGESYKLGPIEYLNAVSQSKFGVSFRGNGPKCFREIECLAFGTPLIITDGVDVNYPFPLIEGTHYIKATSPEDIRKICSTVTPERWDYMSSACYDWFDKYCTIDALFSFLDLSVKNLDKSNKHHKTLYIKTDVADVASTLAVKSLSIFEPRVDALRHTQSGPASADCLTVKDDDLIINQLPFPGNAEKFTWVISNDNIKNYLDTIMDSPLDVHKRLLELCEVKLRFVHAECYGFDKDIVIKELLRNGRVNLPKGASLILKADYDWSRRLFQKYQNVSYTFHGPCLVEWPNIAAFMTYARNDETFCADISDHFIEYFVAYREAMPKENIFQLCRLWEYEASEIVEIVYRLNNDRPVYYHPPFG